MTLVAIILLAGIAYLGRDALRVGYHRLALGRVERGIYYQMNPPQTLLQWLSASLAEPRTTSHSLMWERFWCHEDALVELEYLARHQFSFTNRTLNATQLWTNGQARFASRATMLRVLTNGQFTSTNTQARFGSRFTTLQVVTNGQNIWTAAVCTASVVQVTAPPDEAEKWRALVNEFDRTARESQ